MKHDDGQAQMSAYSEAVRSGHYAKRSGLVGKYDNVRLYWEDELTRFVLRPHLERLINRAQSQMRRLRIMDLGCGSADGYELLAGVRQRDADLKQQEVDLLSDDILGLYRGIDLNEDLLAQARGIYSGNPKMTFGCGDFTQGLPLSKGEEPYDLYFTSFGTFSHHLDDDTAVQLLAQIAEHVDDYCVVVCDWIGRWSYEWQNLWTEDVASKSAMDYVVSYIYPPEERQQRRAELDHLTLRLMSRPEAESILQRASKLAGVSIKPLEWFDRSVFCGRHMDTAEYNAHAQPIRAALNSLHEVNIRTDLSSLLINFVPKPGFDFINQYFEHLSVCWNYLVKYAASLMDAFDETAGEYISQLPVAPVSAPPALVSMMERMYAVVKGIGWLGYGLPRENIIEPQLGYALRYLVSSLQQGQGCAHGLVGVFEIDKTSS